MSAGLTIRRVAGDTWEEQFTVTDGNGVAINIASWTFVMKVGPQLDDDVGAINTPLYSVNGTIVSAPAGTVKFSPTVMNTTQNPGTYYYVIVTTDSAGKIRTSAPQPYEYQPKFA